MMANYSSAEQNINVENSTKNILCVPSIFTKTKKTKKKQNREKKTKIEKAHVSTQ